MRFGGYEYKQESPDDFATRFLRRPKGSTREDDWVYVYTAGDRPVSLTGKEANKYLSDLRKWAAQEEEALREDPNRRTREGWLYSIVHDWQE